MRDLIRDREHLFRLALLFLAGVALFVLARALFVPKGFGDYGHYRSGALDDSRGRVPSFAGRAACAECHGDVSEVKSKGKHAGLGCEACHGPLAAHAADPTTAKAVKPDPKVLCLVCHLRNVAKPEKFPQIDPKDHGEGGTCGDCHKPHDPLGGA